MSRGVHVARELRSAEEKAGGNYLAAMANVAAGRADAGGAILARIEAMASKNKARRKDTSLAKHRFEWEEEARHFGAKSGRLEEELAAARQRLARAAMAGGDGVSREQAAKRGRALLELLEEETDFDLGRMALRNELRSKVTMVRAYAERALAEHGRQLGAGARIAPARAWRKDEREAKGASWERSQVEKAKSAVDGALEAWREDMARLEAEEDALTEEVERVRRKYLGGGAEKEDAGQVREEDDRASAVLETDVEDEETRAHFLAELHRVDRDFERRLREDEERFVADCRGANEATPAAPARRAAAPTSARSASSRAPAASSRASSARSTTRPTSRAATSRGTAAPQLTAEECLSPTGGWTRREHLHFLKIFDDYSRKGKMREEMMERLCIEMASKTIPADRRKTRSAIDRHLTWHYMYINYVKARRAKRQAWRIERRELLAQALAQDRNVALRREAEMLLEAQREEQRRGQEERHARLQALYAERAEALEQELVARRAAAERERQLEAAERERKDEEDELKRQLVAEYRLRKEDEHEARQQQERIAAMEAELSRRAAIEANRGKVEERQQAAMTKIELRLFEEQQRREAEEERQRMLDALKAKVEANVVADGSRATAPTYSSSADVKSAPAYHPKVTGYTTDQVLADKRVALSLALAEAGVGQSAYARSAVAMAPAATKPRIDTFDARQRDQFG